MAILLAQTSFNDREKGKQRFANTLQIAKANKLPPHPVHNWVKSEGINTPALAFDLSIIEDRMRWLSALSEAHSITPLVAVKSCTEPEYLNLANRYLSGFDVSNIIEYSALPQNLQGKLVSITSPYLTNNLDSFCSKGNKLLVSLDSQYQLDNYLDNNRPCEYILRVKVPALLRDNTPPDPAFYPVTRFGFSINEIQNLIKNPKISSCLPAGFHAHHGSEENRLSTYTTIISGLEKLSRQLDLPVKYINLGGGWQQLSPQEFKDALSHARRLFPEPCTILIEPGYWYSKSAGFATGTIVNVSRYGDIIRCTLDLSSKCHLRWSRPALLHSFEPHYDKSCVVQFYGPSCYEADLIGKYFLPYSTDLMRDTGILIGNKVVFGNISIYSTEWNTSFNGVPTANVEWIKDEQDNDQE